MNRPRQSSEIAGVAEDKNELLWTNAYSIIALFGFSLFRRFFKHGPLPLMTKYPVSIMHFIATMRTI
ncbi:hypothetical protein ACMFMG_012179 [Clarireedia jacksonii]